KVEIIQTENIKQFDGTVVKMHYIHMVGTNRRLDRWVEANQISEIYQPDSVFDANESLDDPTVLTRKKKRRQDNYQ
ncbi:MAG: K(lysine) acetyltransferase, partial [Paramarteilia canceri]